MTDLSYIVGQRDWTVPMPKLILDPDEQAVMNIAGLNVWLEPGPDNIVRADNGDFVAWVDRVSRRRFVPRAAAKPLVVSSGATQALRFGFGGTLTGAANGSLHAEDGADLLSATGYTIGILARFPIAAANGGTEGVTTAYGDWFGSEAATSYLVAGTNNQVSTSIRNNVALGSEITYGTRIDDGLWHRHVFSYDFTGKVEAYRKDGVQVQINNSVVREVAVDASPTIANVLKMVIGGAGPLGSDMIGELGAIAHVAGRSLHVSAAAADLAALEARLESRRLALLSA
jgi:hypothetical protein